LHGGTFASNVNSKHGNVFYSPRIMNNAAGAQAVPGALARHYPERNIVVAIRQANRLPQPQPARGSCTGHARQSRRSSPKANWGGAAPETTEAFARGRESASGGKDAPENLAGVYGLWVGGYVRRELP
jgi:hypothetical protein